MIPEIFFKPGEWTWMKPMSCSPWGHVVAHYDLMAGWECPHHFILPYGRLLACDVAKQNFA